MPRRDGESVAQATAAGEQDQGLPFLAPSISKRFSQVRLRDERHAPRCDGGPAKFIRSAECIATAYVSAS
jgi:hypothetical protein